MLGPILITAAVSFNQSNRSQFPPQGFSLQWWQRAMAPEWVDPLWFSLKLASVTALLRSEEHTSELQSQSNLVCRLLLEKKKIAPRASLFVVPPDHRFGDLTHLTLLALPTPQVDTRFVSLNPPPRCVTVASLRFMMRQFM